MLYNFSINGQTAVANKTVKINKETSTFTSVNKELLYT